MILTEGFYWDHDEAARQLSQRFFEQMHFMPTMIQPTMIQAGVYSEVTQYLKAIEDAGTDEAEAVVAKIRTLPIDDFFAHNGKLRADGRLVHDMYLMQVKTPAESKGEWDLYKILATVARRPGISPARPGRLPARRRSLAAARSASAGPAPYAASSWNLPERAPFPWRRALPPWVFSLGAGRQARETGSCPADRSIPPSAGWRSPRRWL